MSEAPKLRAYLVATQWSDGVGSIGLFAEYGAEMAAAQAVILAMRGMLPPTGALTNLLVREVEPGHLRQILLAVESGKPTGEVVQLVPDHRPGQDVEGSDGGPLPKQLTIRPIGFGTPDVEPEPPAA